MTLTSFNNSSVTTISHFFSIPRTFSTLLVPLGADQIESIPSHLARRQEVISVFRDRDRDLDGKMSFEEFCGQKSRYELAFEAIDKNGDGFVSRSEFKKICPSLTPEQTEAAFAKFDLDGTGKINYREFCQMMNSKKAGKK